jgi:hypothetical protein
MKTKIVKKKKKVSKGDRVGRVGKISMVSRLNNKKISKLQWKGMGGSLSTVKPLKSEFNHTLKQFKNSNNEWKLSPTTRKHSQVLKNTIKPLQKIQKLSLKILPENISLIEIGDSFFQIQYINNYTHIKKDKYKEEYYYFIITLDKLSIDKLQYYINTKKITSTDYNDKFFLGLNETTISIKVLNTGGQYRTGSSDDFIDVYESIDINMIPYEKNIEEMAIHNRFRINVGLINDKDEDKDKKDVIPQIHKDIPWLNSTYIDLNASNAVDNTMTNIEYFLKLYNAKQITKETKIFTCDDLNVDHTRLIIDEVFDKDGYQYVIIGYPDKSMKPYIDLYNKHQSEFETIYEEHKTKFMQYMAELHNFMMETNIKEENAKLVELDKLAKFKQAENTKIVENTKLDLTPEEFKKKREKLIFFLDTINNNEPRRFTQDEKLKEEINKFYGYEDYYKYTENFYENAYKECGTPEVFNKTYGIDYNVNFVKDFKTLQKAFYNELANKCLNKPMMKINYVFFIFKKHTDGKYVPAFFNFRELKNKHYSILLRLEYLIKTRLDKIYKILSGTETDYKLWYSHYNYGDIFHIKTEYVHTMSNIQQQAYKYKNSISLEELNYMLSIPDVDLINLRLDYQKKASEFIQGIKNLDVLLSKQEKIITRNKCYIPTSKNPELLEKEVVINLFVFLHKDTKILLMFIETGNIYSIIYKNGIDKKFYKIKLQPNLCSIYIEIFKKLYNNINSVNIFTDFIKKYKEFNKPNKSQITKPNLDLSKIHSIIGLKLYKVLEHKPINTKDYKGIMRYNPLLVRTITQIQNTSIISISNFFQSPLVFIAPNDSYNIKIPNPYFKKPLLIRNFLATKQYRDEFKIFKEKIKLNTSITHEYISNPETIHYPDNKYLFKFLGNDYNNPELNKIYFNPENCSFNLLETKEDTKRVIWVVPFNATMIDKLDDDFTDFIDFKNIYDKDNEPKFIQNFMNLNNEKHIKVLEIIRNKYATNNYSCFLNIGCITPQQVCLHVHVIDTNYYKSTFVGLEQGSRLEKMLDIKKVINILKLNKSYYNKFKCDVLLHDKI